MNSIDLHLHSYFSADGQLSPAELVALALNKGVRCLALTDHNSCRGCPEMAVLAAEANLEFISGIELDCRFQGRWLHVLGYGVDPYFKAFLEIETDIINQEKKNAQAKITAFEALGFQLDRETLANLSPNGIIWGEMIAEVLLADPRNQGHPRLEAYRPHGERADSPFVNFDWDFCSPGQAAHFRVEFIDLKEALGLINLAGGRAVLAHPGRDVREEAELLADIAAEGLWGLEAFSSYHQESQTDFYVNQGRKLNLRLTCGSDFHGKFKPAIEIASIAHENEEELLKNIRLLGRGAPSR